MKATFIALLAFLVCLPALAQDKPAVGKEAAKKDYAEGRYADAVRLFAAELAKEEAKPKPDWRVLSYYNSYLGLAHDGAGQYGKALEFHHKSLAIYLVKLGKDHPSVADTYYNMALTHGAKKNVIKKKELLAKAYAIQLEKLGKDHPDTKNTKAELFGP